VIVCLDANIVIYYVERNPVWEPKVAVRLKAIPASGDSLAVSEAAQLECLVGPLRSGNSSHVADSSRAEAGAAAIRAQPLGEKNRDCRQVWQSRA
jgi:hypothetical protein